MSIKTEVKFVININDKEIILTEDEALTLFSKLKKFFDNKENVYIPYPQPVYPWWEWSDTVKVTYLSGDANSMTVTDVYK